MDFVSLLGESLDSPAVRELFDSLSAHPKVDAQGYFQIRSRGVELAFAADSTLDTVFLFHHGVTEGQLVVPFSGTLPKGLQFGMGRSEVRSLLGTPSHSRELPTNGMIKLFPHDKYSYTGWYLHVTYVEDCSSIALVTIGIEEEESQDIASDATRNGAPQR